MSSLYAFEQWKSGPGLETEKAKWINSAKKQKAYMLRKELRKVADKGTPVLYNYWRILVFESGQTNVGQSKWRNKWWVRDTELEQWAVKETLTRIGLWMTTPTRPGFGGQQKSTLGIIADFLFRLLLIHILSICRLMNWTNIILLDVNKTGKFGWTFESSDTERSHAPRAKAL